MKVTLLVNGPRAGFSDTFYTALTDVDEAVRATRQLATVRGALLALDYEVIGARLTDWPSGQTIRSLDTGGGGQLLSEVSQLSIKFFMRSGDGSRRSWYLRGVPDSVVAAGEFRPVLPYPTLIADFTKELRVGPWALKVISKLWTPARLNGISAAGVFSTVENHNIAATQYGKLMRVRDITGRRFGPIVYITAAGTPTTGTMIVPAGFPGAVGGSIRRYEQVLSKIAVAVRTGVGVRKTGRPFGLVAGRRSKPKTVLIR